MQGLALQRSENHHLQGAGEKVSLFAFFHEWGVCSRPKVIDYLKQGLEQNSLIDIYSQELFLSDCQDAIEFVASSGLNRNAQLLTGDLGDRRELEKKAKAEGRLRYCGQGFAAFYCVGALLASR